MPPKSIPTDDFETIAEEIDLLVLDRVRQAVPAAIDQRLAVLNADLEARNAALQVELRNVQKAGAEVEAWLPNRFPRGATVAHRGGTWRCIASQGAEAAHEPNPDSPVWLPVTVGISEMKARKISVGHGELVCRLSNGTELKVDVPLPRMNLRGLHKPEETYKELDVVTRDGGSFVARYDNPGALPGPGWQVLAQRGKSAVLDVRQVKDIAAWLESKANATSYTERLEHGLSVDLMDTMRAHPQRATSQLAYRAFVADLVGAIIGRIAEVIGIAEDGMDVVRMASTLLVYPLFAPYEVGKKRAQPPAPKKGLAQRNALTVDIEREVLVLETRLFGDLIERLPAALGAPERRERLLAYTEAFYSRLAAADGELHQRHRDAEVAEAWRIPKPMEAVYKAGTGENSGGYALAVATALAPLLASRNPEVQRGCRASMDALSGQAA